MKKTWNNPAIEELKISQTAMESYEGDKVDGTYLDFEDCQYKNLYS